MSESSFDLERAVRGYMRGVTDKRLVSRDCRDELESHLRDEIDDLVRAGHHPRAAFERAASALGGAGALRREFDKLYGGSRRAQLANLLSHYFDRRIVMRVCFGLAFGLFFMLGGLLLEGGHLKSIMHLTAAFIAVGGALGALLVAYPARVVGRSAVLALTGGEATRTAYLDAANVFRTFGDLCVLAGFVGAIFGTIHVLENLQYPDRIGPGVAVAIVSILYGVLAKLFIGRPLFDSFTARANPPVLTRPTTDAGDESGGGGQDRMMTA